MVEIEDRFPDDDSRQSPQSGAEGKTPTPQHDSSHNAEDISSSRINMKAQVCIVYRSNTYYDDIIPRLALALEERLGYEVSVKSFARGFTQQEIGNSLSELGSDLSNALILSDVTCRESFPEDGKMLSAVNSRFLPNSLGSYVDKVLLKKLSKDVDLVVSLGSELRQASKDFRACLGQLEIARKAVVGLLAIVKDAGTDFEEVLLCPRHMLDHMPFAGFYGSTIREYLKLMQGQIDDLDPAELGSAKHQELEKKLTEMQAIYKECDTVPWTESYLRSTFSDWVIAELQSEVGDRYNLTIRQPVEVLEQWILESGIGNGNIHILDSKALRDYSNGEFEFGEESLLVADRHFCNMRELRQAGVDSLGTLALLPLSDFYERLRTQNVLNRGDVPGADEILEDLYEVVAQAIRKEELDSDPPLKRIA